jgi:hypothetical protein
MTTVHEECTIDEQRSVVRFFLYVQNDAMQRIFITKRFLFTAGSVCRVNPFIIGSRNSLKDVRKFVDDAPVQVRKWLRQQSKDFCAAGFDALVKRRDRCMDVRGEYVEKYFFFRFEYHMFYVLCSFVAYLLILTRSVRPI